MKIILFLFYPVLISIFKGSRQWKLNIKIEKRKFRSTKAKETDYLVEVIFINIIKY